MLRLEVEPSVKSDSVISSEKHAYQWFKRRFNNVHVYAGELANGIYVAEEIARRFLLNNCSFVSNTGIAQYVECQPIMTNVWRLYSKTEDYE